MMATYVQKGENINYKNDGSEKIAYGDVVVISDRIGVASVDISAGETGVISLEGVYEMPAEASAAFEVGQTVYWDTTNKRLTATKPASRGDHRRGCDRAESNRGLAGARQAVRCGDD